MASDGSDPHFAPRGASLAIKPTGQTGLPDQLCVVIQEAGKLEADYWIPMPGIIALLRQETDSAVEGVRGVTHDTFTSPRAQLNPYSLLTAVELTLDALLEPGIRVGLEPKQAKALKNLRRTVKRWQARYSEP